MNSIHSLTLQVTLMVDEFSMIKIEVLELI